MSNKTKLLTLEESLKIIETELPKMNELLKNTNFEAELYQTSEYYEDCEETDIYYNQPMFESNIIYKDTEEDFEENDFGRYCDINSCVEELYQMIDYILNRD